MNIRLDNVSFAYSEARPILHGIDFAVDEGEFVLMAGPNGAGKSTILKLLNGILKPRSGTVTVDSLDTLQTSTTTLASHIAVTFQNPSDQIFASTVRRELLFGPRILKRRHPETLVDRSIDLFQFQEWSAKHPYDLSTSQRKLLTIASAVATDAPILAFDEPTASLSQPEREILRAALTVLRRERRTILVVSHDLDFFIPRTTRLILLNEGRIVHVGIPSDINEKRGIVRRAAMSLPLAIRLQRLARTVEFHQ